MKKIVVLIMSFMLCNFLFSEDHKDVLMWKSKTFSEKRNYVEGILDGLKYLSEDIDVQVTKEEKNKIIDNKTANRIEIPIIYSMFVIGNVQTNGVKSIVSYIDESYSQQLFRQYSIYELLILGAKGNLIQNKDFAWMFE